MLLACTCLTGEAFRPQASRYVVRGTHMKMVALQQRPVNKGFDSIKERSAGRGDIVGMETRGFHFRLHHLKIGVFACLLRYTFFTAGKGLFEGKKKLYRVHRPGSTTLLSMSEMKYDQN